MILKIILKNHHKKLNSKFKVSNINKQQIKIVKLIKFSKQGQINNYKIKILIHKILCQEILIQCQIKNNQHKAVREHKLNRKI